MRRTRIGRGDLVLRSCARPPLISVAVTTYPRCARRGQPPERRPGLGVLQPLMVSGRRARGWQAIARQHVARPVWPAATHSGTLTARRLVITFVPTTGRKLEDDPKSTARPNNSTKAITPERRALHRLTIRSQPLHLQANQLQPLLVPGGHRRRPSATGPGVTGSLPLEWLHAEHRAHRPVWPVPASLWPRWRRRRPASILRARSPAGTSRARR
jgi:hypothetical protein